MISVTLKVVLSEAPGAFNDPTNEVGAAMSVVADVSRAVSYRSDLKRVELVSIAKEVK